MSRVTLLSGLLELHRSTAASAKPDLDAGQTHTASKQWGVCQPLLVERLHCVCCILYSLQHTAGGRAKRQSKKAVLEVQDNVSAHWKD